MSSHAASGRKGLWSRFAHHKGALCGAAGFGAIVLAVLLGPVIWRVDPGYIDLVSRSAPPSWAHPLGTDQLGRDQLARLLAGGRISLAVGLCAMGVAVFLGCVIGVLAGVWRWLDGPLMRLTDLFLSLPLLPLLLVLVMLFRDTLSAQLGSDLGVFFLVVLAIGLTSWMPIARIIRSDVLALKERDFIVAAQAIGTRKRHLITRHILPNIRSPIIVSATLGIANAIITESALSFLGLGFSSDFATWGRLLNDAIPYLQTHPARAVWPGLAISLTVLAVNYMGDGLRDAFDPRQQRPKG